MTKPANTTDASDTLIASWAADLIELEQQINDLQDAKKRVYASIREDHGRVLADGVKNAVRLDRMDSEKRQRAEATDTETERVLSIIAASRVRVAHVRVRESDPDHDPITGEIIDTNSADPTHVAADQSTGNVDGSAGRSHSDCHLSTESPASVPVDTNSHLQHDAGDRADTDPHSLVGSSNSHLQDDLGDQAGAAAAGLSNTAAAPNKRRPYCRMPGACTGFGDKHCFTCDMRRDSLKPVGLSIGAADIPHEGQIH